MKQNMTPSAVFVGTTPNIGTTTAAFATALRLAEESGGTIGFLCLHLKSAKLHRFLGVDEPAMTLDRLQPELRSASLTPDLLKRAMYALPGQPNLHILFGSLNREQAEFFRPEEMEHLLAAAKRAFDFVVLDVGAYWDNAATVCSIRSASTRILVTTPALSHFQEDGKRWIGQVSPLFKVEPADYDCVVVRGAWGSEGYGIRQICQELGVKPLGELQLNGALYSSFDKGGFHDWLKSDSGGRKSMTKPAKELMRRHDLRRMGFAPMNSQPWYRKLAKLRSGVDTV